MGFRDENNEIVGFDIDVAKEVAARLGVEFIAQPISWDAKELELASGTIDCIWNGMSITPEREESMAMTFPYLNKQMIFYTRAGAGIEGLEDLAGKSVAESRSSYMSIINQAHNYGRFIARATVIITLKINLGIF